MLANNLLLRFYDSRSYTSLMTHLKSEHFKLFQGMPLNINEIHN